MNGSVDQSAPRRRRITFNELVHSVDDDEETEWHQLKSDDVTPTPEDPQVAWLFQTSLSLPEIQKSYPFCLTVGALRGKGCFQLGFAISKTLPAERDSHGCRSNEPHPPNYCSRVTTKDLQREVSPKLLSSVRRRKTIEC